MTKQKIKRKIKANNRLIHKSSGQKDFIFDIADESKVELEVLLSKQEKYREKSKNKEVKKRVKKNVKKKNN